MSLLTICQAAATDTPAAIPATIINNTDSMAQLLLGCAQRAGEALARYKGGGWTVMQKEFDFSIAAVTVTGNVTQGSPVITGITPSTTGIAAGTFGATGPGILVQNSTVLSVDSASQVTMAQPAATSGTGVTLVFGQFGYALPSDFQRTITDTEWDRSRRWPIVGPRSPQQWQLYKSGLIGTATFQRRWRIKELTVNGVVGRYFAIDPVPTDNGSQLVFEYVSNSWCQSASNALQTSWQADSDTSLLDEYLLTLGTRWRFLRRLGQAYDEELNEYETEAAKAFANDGGMPILDMAPTRGTQLINPWNVPDTGFGGVSG